MAENWNKGAYVLGALIRMGELKNKKHIPREALIIKGALTGRSALNRIITVPLSKRRAQP